jgi:hypothetical protein
VNQGHNFLLGYDTATNVLEEYINSIFRVENQPNNKQYSSQPAAGMVA